MLQPLMEMPRRCETPGNFTAAMAAAATGVSIVSTDGPGGRFGITVSAVSSVSAEPPMLLACINRRSPAVAAIAANGTFAVSLLAASQRSVAQCFAGRPVSGDAYDFSPSAWNEGISGTPVLVGASAVFECAVEHALDAGTHRIFVGRVLSAFRGEDEPLLYANRRFGRPLALDH
jgi:flavin reductase (DIM6/NTAB) family NADH-FMN oxidoreductase RutF